MEKIMLLCYTDRKSMEHPQPSTQRAERGPCARFCFPFLVFSLVTLALLAVSRAYLLPQFTRMTVNGQLVTPDDLPVLEAELEQELSIAEARRIAMVQPIRDSMFTMLKAQKSADLPLASVDAFLAEILADRPELLQGIVIDRFRLNARTHEVRLHGAIQNVGPRSMTVLAEFVDRLRAHPSVHALVAPAFVRESASDGSFFSPFSLSFILGNGVSTPSALPT